MTKITLQNVDSQSILQKGKNGTKINKKKSLKIQNIGKKMTLYEFLIIITEN